MTTHKDIYYSNRYKDDDFEYSSLLKLSTSLIKCIDQLRRHVILTKELAKQIPQDRLMSEDEWRAIGVQQSQGWQHYMFHKPEPHVLMFKRPRTDV